MPTIKIDLITSTSSRDHVHHGGALPHQHLCLLRALRSDPCFIALFGPSYDKVAPIALRLLIWAMDRSHDMVDSAVALDQNVVGMGLWEPPIPTTATGGHPWRYYMALLRLGVVGAWVLLRGGFVLFWRRESPSPT